MTDDDLQLATAYLDGELDTADRARVELDPDLLAVVEEQRQVRAVLADVEAPSISRREAHLAAALDAWDRVPRTDGTPTGVAAVSTPASSSRDRRVVDWNRRLLAAAAALVVVVGAGVALQTFTQIDGDDSDSGNELLDAAGDAARDGEADDALAESAPAAVEGQAAVDGDGDGDDDSDLATAGTIDVGSDNASPPRENDLEQLRGPDDLAIFASDALGAPVADQAPDAGEATVDGGAPLAEIELPLCLGADLLVGPARYRDQIVVVGIDEGRDLALAYLPDGCVEVARAPLPPGQP